MTDPVDVRDVAVVALRTDGLRQVVAEDTTVALRLRSTAAANSADESDVVYLATATDVRI